MGQSLEMPTIPAIILAPNTAIKAKAQTTKTPKVMPFLVSIATADSIGGNCNSGLTSLMLILGKDLLAVLLDLFPLLLDVDCLAITTVAFRGILLF